MWILAWLTAAPVRVVRAALKRVEQGDLRGDLVVFDGTELGELQRGFNAMVNGLRERERVRDLFGRHVGREVAAAAERERPQLGGEDRHAAVVFVDIVGSTQLVDNQPAAHVVKLLNRFFAIVVNEVDRHHGLINKFAGDAALAIFGAPNRLDRPEDAALAAARAIAERLANEMPEVQAGIGVAAGQIVAGNVGAKQRFEYTVVGKPVNQAARLCELAKSHPARLLASSDTLHAASETDMRSKIPDLQRALEGRFDDHHALMCRLHLAHLDQLDAMIGALDEQIEQLMHPFCARRELIASIPGIGVGASATVISEIGADPAAWFPSAEHLASWVRLCPGNHESAGKRHHGARRTGNQHLQPVLVECAWAAVRTDGYLREYYRRQVRKFGGFRSPAANKKAIIAVAHKLIVIIWHVLATGRPYQDLGADYFTTRMDPDKERRRLVAKLEAQGLGVTLEPAA